MANRDAKRCSVSLIIREMQTIPVRMAIIKKTRVTSVDKVMEERELLCIVGRNINGCSYYGKWYKVSSKNLK